MGKASLANGEAVNFILNDGDGDGLAFARTVLQNLVIGYYFTAVVPFFAFAQAGTASSIWFVVGVFTHDVAIAEIYLPQADDLVVRI